MKIFYLCSSNDSTAYTRAYLPGMALRELGHEVNFNIDWFEKPSYEINQELVDKAAERATQNLKHTDEADLIVMQRPGNLAHLKAMWNLKNQGKKIVVEHDDLFSEIPELSPFSVYELDMESYELCIMGADRVTVSTDYLKAKLLKHNFNITTVPNGLDLSLYKPQEKTDTGKFRIGIIGSVAFADNQKSIDIKEIASIPNVQLVVFGLPSPEEMQNAEEDFKKNGHEKIWKARLKQMKPFEGIDNIEFHDYVPITEYPDKLASLNLDIAILPREQSSFNKAKSNIKFIECSALKIPTICQHFLDNDSPYDIDAQKTEMMIMLRSGWGLPTFKEQIEKLINDEDLRKQIAENAYEFVQRYDIKKTVLEWEDLFKSIAGTD